jgi:putative transposase
MASKKHRPEEAVAKLRQVDVLVSQGQTVAEAIRAIGVTEVTYYRWRREFGGLKSDQVKRLKALEAENARLRKCKRRRKTPSLKRPGGLVAPERNSGGRQALRGDCEGPGDEASGAVCEGPLRGAD